MSATKTSHVESNSTVVAARKKRLYSDLLAIIERNVANPPTGCAKRVASEAQLMMELATEPVSRAEVLPITAHAFNYTPRKQNLMSDTSMDRPRSVSRISHTSVSTSNNHREEQSATLPSHTKPKPVLPSFQHHRYATEQ